MYQNYNYYPQQTKPVGYSYLPSTSLPAGLKGRPVSSFEEARAAQVDFDGSLHIFTDIGNKKIYTKQINLDGTATLHTYSLVEDDTPTKEIEYVTKSEFNQALVQLEAMINSKEPEKKKVNANF